MAGCRAEQTGLCVRHSIVIERPHPKVTFANDFSKRLDPNSPGMKVVLRGTASIPTADQDKKNTLYGFL